eukprot:CAMPEP_0170517858 /NCGR_PEP_ID=MMETSP0209-20121228/3696_1 /TAXON_ID=665100 ORGANISM="Litonotus pictus, Strain P1" /NCGR_SAMPLE_ID=MMETSP0209 /ASSEMBLY_ACC=CAM_ASM_000301 /LENGTH=318 /DNA_ID=CAMNT_0010803211 /DNA_START=1 /DNA_END=954 /DNA_ORIENTATION=+
MKFSSIQLILYLSTTLYIANQVICNTNTTSTDSPKNPDIDTQKTIAEENPQGKAENNNSSGAEEKEDSNKENTINNSDQQQRRTSEEIKKEDIYTDDDIEAEIAELEDQQLYQEDQQAQHYQNIDEDMDTEVESEEELSELEKELMDFDPHDILTVVIPKKSHHNFYVETTKPSIKIKASFHVIEEEEEIDYKINLPDNSQYLHIKKESHDFSIFQANSTGLYTFSLLNKYSSGDVKVSFAVHSEDHTDHFFNKTHMDYINTQLDSLDKKTGNFWNLYKIFNENTQAHHSHTKKHNKSIVVFSLVETAVLIMVFYFQL